MKAKRLDVTAEKMVAPEPGGIYDLDWFVIHTNPRCENRAIRGLRARGFEVYAPQTVTWKVIRQKKGKQAKRVKVWKLAYPRYLFVGMKSLSWELIHSCDGVSGIVCMNRSPVRIDSGEIADLMAAEDMGCFDFCAEPQQVVVGDQVMITHGPFDGYRATVKRVDGNSDASRRVTVDVHVLGRATPTVVPLDLIRLLA